MPDKRKGRLMPKAIFVYHLNTPIDFWTGWRTEAEFLAHAAEEANSFIGADTLPGEYLEFRQIAMELAYDIGWDGNIRKGEGGPYVIALPNEDCNVQLVIAWKSDNNGDTFVASPRPLPWLDTAWKQTSIEVENFNFGDSDGGGGGPKPRLRVVKPAPPDGAA
jgi:hypothetical protein